LSRSRTLGTGARRRPARSSQSRPSRGGSNQTRSPARRGRVKVHKQVHASPVRTQVENPPQRAQRVKRSLRGDQPGAEAAVAQTRIKPRYTFARGRFVRYLLAGRAPTVLIDAVHAAAPKSDAHTGGIAELAAKRLGSHCIVALVSRTRADLNRPRTDANAAAIDEYRGAIRACLEGAGLLLQSGRVGAPFLHIAVHGMKDNSRCDVEIGTRYGQTCTPAVEKLVAKALHNWASSAWVSKTPRLATNLVFVGDASKVVHRDGHPESGYVGYGSAFNTVQLEFANWLRSRHRNRIVEVLVDIGRAFEGDTGNHRRPADPCSRPSRRG